MGAWAICADPVAGWEIEIAHSPASSAATRATEAVCPPTKRALGSGARINFPIDLDPSGSPVVDEHGIGLQIVRASGTGDITRAQAQEQPGG